MSLGNVDGGVHGSGTVHKENTLGGGAGGGGNHLACGTETKASSGL